MAERSEADLDQSLEPFIATAVKAIRYAAACAYSAGWLNGYEDGRKRATQPVPLDPNFYASHDFTR